MDRQTNGRTKTITIDPVRVDSRSPCNTKSINIRETYDPILEKRIMGLEHTSKWTKYISLAGSSLIPLTKPDVFESEPTSTCNNPNQFWRFELFIFPPKPNLGIKVKFSLNLSNYTLFKFKDITNISTRFPASTFTEKCQNRSTKIYQDNLCIYALYQL